MEMDVATQHRYCHRGTETQKKDIEKTAMANIAVHEDYPLKNETDIIIGLAIEVHKILGAGLLEIVYKDALEYELNVHDYLFVREREYNVPYK
jgi:hypothetical protein